MKYLEKDLIVTTRPILNRQHEIFGYELIANSISNNLEPNKNTEYNLDILIKAYKKFELEKIFQGKKIFIKSELESDLLLNSLDIISPRHVVLEIIPPQIIFDDKLISTISDKMSELRKNGFSLVISENIFNEDYKEWFDFIQYVKFENLILSNQQKLEIFVKKTKFNCKKIIGENVDTQEQFNLLKNSDFDYYVGEFFKTRTNYKKESIESSSLTLLNLFNMVAAQREYKEIEEELKKDPSFSYRLLLYMNCVGIGQGERISSFNRALMILGYKNLGKWLSVLFSSTHKKVGIDVISRTALIRAKFMENIAKIIDPIDSDSYFVVGMFSMLDAMLDVDLTSALNSLNINEELKDSILEKKGKYKNSLLLAKWLDGSYLNRIDNILLKMNINTEKIAEKYWESIRWVEEIKREI